MGYFRRPIDRGRARREVRDLHEGASEARAWEAIPTEPPPPGRYLRFAARDVHARSLRRRGIFAAAYELRVDCGADADVVRRIDEALAWFDAELPSPSLREPRAIFLFRSSASACIGRIWDLVHALGDANVPVEMQSFENPGRVVYQDEHQIAVVPWSDVEEL